MSVIAAIIAVLFMSLHFAPVISLNSRILSRGLPLGRMCAGSWMIWGVGAKEAVGGRSCWLLVPASDACCWSWGVGCGVLLMCIDGVFKKKP